MSETPDLDLDRMQARRDAYAKPGRLVHVAFLHGAGDDLEACIGEIHRLRALLAVEREHKDALRERLSIIRRYIDELPQE